MKLIRPSSREMDRLCQRGIVQKRRLAERVRRILEEVRLNGDDALLRYTRKFDRVALTAKTLRVSEGEISGAFQHIDPKIITHLKQAIQNVEQFYRRRNAKPWKMLAEDGVVLAKKYDPLERVGVYIPAGTASLVSTVYMTVLPARMAGVPRIILATPPNQHGSVDPYILAVANLLKVNEIYKMGGAQAIAALAYGTRTVPKVDKIVGPGNPYVAEAKRQVFGAVDIDMTAGPSEVAVIANQHADPKHVLADLQGEGEHAGGLSILITPSKPLAKLARTQLAQGYVILVKSLREAVDVANRLAPEHLQIVVKNPAALVKQIRHAGAIFVGPYSPVTVGDYVAGPSHVLPTGGSARWFSGLCVEDFLRHTHVITYSRKALERMREAIAQIAAIEGLPKHYEAVRIRLEG